MTLLFKKNRVLYTVATAFFAALVSPVYAANDGKLGLCTSCHSKDVDHTILVYPELTGMHTEYIMKQMLDFKSGKRKSLFMEPISTQVDEKDIVAIANYYSAQPRVPGAVRDAALAKQGEKIFASGFAGKMDACAKCHGNEGEGTAKYPRLNGQHPKYLVQQLQDFKNGVRNNDNNNEMSKIAKQLSEQDMAALAEYIFALKEEPLYE